MELGELTLEQQELTLEQEELTPMPLLTRELPSPTWLILRLQLSLAMLSNLTNGNKVTTLLYFLV